MLLHELPKPKQYRYYLVIDTETTGIFHEKNHIVQLSYLILNQEFNPVIKKDFIIYVEEEITNSHIHGITSELSHLSGIHIDNALNQLWYDVRGWESQICIVGHNIEFDLKFLLSEVERVGHKPLKNFLSCEDRFCTMLYSTDICCIPNKWNTGNKYPKLEQLYEFLYNNSFNGTYHNAMDDVIATSECFKKLMETNKR